MAAFTPTQDPPCSRQAKETWYALDYDGCWDLFLDTEQAQRVQSMPDMHEFALQPSDYTTAKDKLLRKVLALGEGRRLVCACGSNRQSNRLNWGNGENNRNGDAFRNLERFAEEHGMDLCKALLADRQNAECRDRGVGSEWNDPGAATVLTPELEELGALTKEALILNLLRQIDPGVQVDFHFFDDVPEYLAATLASVAAHQAAGHFTNVAFHAWYLFGKAFVLQTIRGCYPTSDLRELKLGTQEVTAHLVKLRSNGWTPRFIG